MLLLLRFTGHKKLASVLGLLTTFAVSRSGSSPTTTCG
jgi:hypothetical protein